MNNRFKLGDIVRPRKGEHYENHNGTITQICLSSKYIEYDVKFPREGHGKSQYYFYDENDLMYDEISEKENWIKTHYEAYKSDKNISIIKAGEDDITMIFNPSTLKVGIAKKSKEDKFDLKTGLAVAYARYLGEKIPKDI